MSFAQTYTRHYFQIMEFKPKFSYKLFGGGETLRRRQGEERKELKSRKSRNSHKPVSIHESSLKYERQKKTEGKKMRDDKEKVQEIIFALFEKHQYYNIKDLERETRQPIAYLKEILKEVCNYSVKPPHRNM